LAAAVLSNRYVADRFLPDKAIDLVDEAASKLRMEIDSMPVELDEIERRVMQLEIERERCERKKTRRRGERLASSRRIGGSQEDRGAWPRSAAGEGRDSRVAHGQTGFEGVRLEIEAAQRRGDYAKASELQYDVCLSSSSRFTARKRAAGPADA